MAVRLGSGRLVLGTVLALMVARNSLAYNYRSYWKEPLPPKGFVTRPYLQLGPACWEGEDNAPLLGVPGCSASLLLVWETPTGTSSQDAWQVETAWGTGDFEPIVLQPTCKTTRLPDLQPFDVYTCPLAPPPTVRSLRYRVCHQGQVVFEAKAMVPPSRGRASRFAVFGDCGTGGAGQKALAPVIAQAHPDLLCIPGDIVYPRGSVREYRVNFDAIYNHDQADPKEGAPLLRSIPCVAAAGNHDLGTLHRAQANLDRDRGPLGYYLHWQFPLNGPLTAEQAEAATLGAPAPSSLASSSPFSSRPLDGAALSARALAPPGATSVYPLLEGSAERQAGFRAAAGARFPRMANYSFDFGNTHWTVLDSNERVDWRSPELRRWLERDLAQAQGAAWRFVMFHHPPYHSSARHAECTQMRCIAGLLERGRVSVVWCGHVHDYQRCRPLSVLPSAEEGSARAEALENHPRVDRDYNGTTVTRARGVLYVVSGQGGYKGGLERLSTSFVARPWSDVWHMERPTFTDLRTFEDHLEVRQIDDRGAEVDHFRLERDPSVGPALPARKR